VNPGKVMKGVKSITFNGRAIKGPLPVAPAGSINEAKVVMG